MSLEDRIDPRPPRRIYRWDLDKTYLATEFDTVADLLRAAFEKAKDKVAVPGATALIRELRASGDTQLCIVSGSPVQMRAVLADKLKLDGVEFDELVLKDPVRELLRGRFRAVKGQVGYKLPVLLESRARAPVAAEEVLFGDDAEADAFIYSLYADMVSRRVSPATVERVLSFAGVYHGDAQRILAAWESVAQSDPVRRIFIHLDRLTPPAAFAGYGPRLVPIFNYFQAALVLLADGHVSAPAVLRVGVDMVQTAGHNLLTLAGSFHELLRRGLPLEHVATALGEALKGPEALWAAFRPFPDIVAAFSKRVALLGAPLPPPSARAVDYLAMLDDARPRRRGKPSPNRRVGRG